MNKVKGPALGFGLAALLVVGLACGAGKPPASEDPGKVEARDPLSLPEATAPMGLGDVELPEDADSIVSLFNRLPRELTGRERTPRLDETGPSRFTSVYRQLPEDGCSSVRIQADDLSSGGFFPADWTADRFVAWLGLRADGDVKDLGRDGDLFWVRGNTTCRSALSPRATQSAPSPQSYPVSSLTWGKAGSRWVFSIMAGSSEDLAELAAAAVIAVE